MPGRAGSASARARLPPAMERYGRGGARRHVAQDGTWPAAPAGRPLLRTTLDLWAEVLVSAVAFAESHGERSEGPDLIAVGSMCRWHRIHPRTVRLSSWTPSTGRLARPEAAAHRFTAVDRRGGARVSQVLSRGQPSLRRHGWLVPASAGAAKRAGLDVGPTPSSVRCRPASLAHSGLARVSAVRELVKAGETDFSTLHEATVWQWAAMCDDEA
jgi:hypothetical protein